MLGTVEYHKLYLVLGDLDNRKPLGILRNNENPGNIKNNVTWAKAAG